MLGLRLRRLRYAARVSGTSLQQAWNGNTAVAGTDWHEVSFLVCDAEMSSLDPTEGEMLSLGWVCVEQGAIALESARHYLLKARNSVGQSATIHQLRDCELRAGRSESEILQFFYLPQPGEYWYFTMLHWIRLISTG